MANVTSVDYLGNVEVKLQIGNKIIDLDTGHNKGTYYLQKVFARMLQGDTISKSDIPQYLDLEYKEGGEWPTDFEDGTTFLKSLVSLTSPVISPEIDNLDVTPAVTFTATIYSTNLSKPIADLTSDEQLRFVLKTECKNSYKRYLPIAWKEISPKVLEKLQPGTQAIITWVMKVNCPSEATYG